jgi:GAF domain-containing protein
VQDTFERISAIAGKVVAHDALALPVFLPGGRQAQRYAAIGMGMATPELIDVPDVFLDPDWEYDLIDDAATMAGAHNARVTAMGFVSVVRVPIRLDGKNAAALIFLSKARAAFKPGDILVARRIADRLAVALARDGTVEAYKRADEASDRAARLEARVQALTEELDEHTGYRRVIGQSRRGSRC